MSSGGMGNEIQEIMIRFVSATRSLPKRAHSTAKRAGLGVWLYRPTVAFLHRYLSFCLLSRLFRLPINMHAVVRLHIHFGSIDGNLGSLTKPVVRGFLCRERIHSDQRRNTTSTDIVILYSTYT